MPMPAASAMAIASAAPFSGLSLPAKTAPSPAVGDHGIERGGMSGGVIASGVGDLDARHLRSGRGVDLDVVAPGRQAAGKIGYEHLRPAALRLADRTDQRRDQRDPHRGITLKARSFGGFVSITSYGTRLRRRRRTSAAAPG